MQGKYDVSDICAVIVAYNPGQDILENIASIRKQKVPCLVLDNGSTEGTGFLEQAKKDGAISLIPLGENRGIAAALNIGLKHCEENGYSLMLTMDQDTVLDHDAIQALLSCMNETNAASVGINWDGRIDRDTEVEYLITSGNLIKTEALRQAGGYDEALFIDSVDFDISLRLIDQGERLIKVAGAKAVHHLGDSQDGGRYRTHSEQRYYYIYRNHYYLIRKHRKKHKSFCIKKQIFLWIDVAKIILFDHNKSKLKMLRKGRNDAKQMSVDEREDKK